MLQNHPKLIKVLRAFTDEYCDNPFRYLYEADVQVMLSRHLESVFSEPHLLKREQSHYPSLESVENMDIGKVQREYPAGILFDNVVLGEPLQLADDKKATNDYFENWYHQPIRYAIELKLVPLYLLPRTKGADDSMDDYQRFVGWVNNGKKLNKKSKLNLLDEYQSAPLEYGMQLTLLQSLEDQEYFLNNHDPGHRPRYESWFADFRELIRKHDNVGYYYVDLASKSVKLVYPQ